jgi:hypothetical protein
MSPQRDDKGRFTKGASGNPKGRSPREVEREYLDITIGAVTPDNWKKIVDRAVMEAELGDKDARKWLSEYLLGKPKQRVDVTTDDQPIFNFNYVPPREEDEEDED